MATNPGHYVVPLKNQPVLFLTEDWRRDFFEWFRRSGQIDIPLVYIKNPTDRDHQFFKLASYDLAQLPKKPLSLPHPVIKETVGNDFVEFDTNLIGYPHLIKISYHPNWQVSGAERIYMVSPAMMLVYPKTQHVRLHFGKTLPNYLGEGLTLAGLAIIIFSGIISLKYARKS